MVKSDANQNVKIFRDAIELVPMDPPGEPQNPNLNYNLLLQQIQTLSELQNNGGIQNADPSIQVSFFQQLTQS